MYYHFYEGWRKFRPNVFRHLSKLFGFTQTTGLPYKESPLPRNRAERRSA